MQLPELAAAPPARPIEAVGIVAVRDDCSEAFLAGAPLDLTYAQRRLLLALLRHRGRVVRREELYESAFGRSLPRGSRAVDIHIGRIRRALGPHSRAIVSMRPIGYRLDPSLLTTAASAR